MAGAGSKAADGLAAVLVAAGGVTFLAADANVHGPTGAFNPLAYVSGAATGWATEAVTERFSIDNRQYWVTSWEAVLLATGIGLLIVSSYCRPTARTFALAFGALYVLLGTTGFVWAWPFGS